MNALRVEEVATRYLLMHGQFLLRELIESTGLSRAVVKRHVKRLAELQITERRGAGRGTYYVGGAGFHPWGPSERGAPRGVEAGSFWEQLTQERQLGYLRLAAVGPRLTTRAQARSIGVALFTRLQFVLVDCRGVQQLSPSFLEELFVAMANEHSVWLEPINAADDTHALVSALVSRSPEHVVNAGRLFLLGERRGEPP